MSGFLTARKMKCHYEMLEVARDADADEIKKSYRKLALKWHPDKNPEKVEECTKYFALIQGAYDVLSDPQERSFYDKHRESIIKGGFDGDMADTSIDLFKFFSASCYKGYGNDAKGFFAVYRKVFQDLANEDYEHMDEYEEKNYPVFGDANSDCEEIAAKFYGFWLSFSTCRSFVWLEKYDIRHADGRWQSRQIEQENKRFRDAGKQERNDQIRQLVAFVRKRDPRMKEYRERLELKKAEAKKKQEENRKKQIIQNQMVLNSYLDDKEAEAERLAHLMEVSMQMAEDYDTCSDEDGEDADKGLQYCVVCNKSFRTENAKANHDNSKLHIKKLAELKKHMKEEDAELFDNSKNESSSQPQNNGKKGKKNRKKKGNGIFDLDETEPIETTALNEPAPEENVVEVAEPEPSVETAEEPAKKEKKKRRADKKTNAAKSGNDDKDDEDENNEGAAPKTGRCDRCKEVFESRTKLFAHIKETGHATLLVNKKAEPKKKNKKGRRGGGDDDDDWS